MKVKAIVISVASVIVIGVLFILYKYNKNKNKSTLPVRTMVMLINGTEFPSYMGKDAVTTKDSSGNKVETYADGYVITTLLDNSRIMSGVDGKVYQVSADGKTVTLYTTQK